MSSTPIRVAGYLAYVIAFVALLVIASNYNAKLESIRDATYKYPYSLIIHSIIVPMLFGAFFALPEFIKRVKQPGAWSFDWIRFLIVGLPALYIACFTLYPCPVFYKVLFLVIAKYPTIIVIAGVLFGYVALMSLDKNKVKNRTSD